MEESEEQILDCIVVALSSDPPEPPPSSRPLFLPPGTPEPPPRIKQEKEQHFLSSSFSSSFCDYQASSPPAPQIDPAPDESDQGGQQADQGHVNSESQAPPPSFVDQPASSPEQDTVVKTGFKRRERDNGLESAGLGCIVS